MKPQFRFAPSVVALAALLLIGAAPIAQATTWNVPGDMSDTCTVATPSCTTIAGAIAASSASDTIEIAAGTYNESSLIVDKALTIDGAGAALTIVDPAGGFGFFIRADDVTLEDLTIQNASDGARIDLVAGTVDNTSFHSVHFVGSTSDGLELSTGTITNVTVSSCEFRGGNNGIRMASTSLIDGVTITGSLFKDNTGLGIYQANDGSTSRLNDLSVTGSTFDNNGDAGGDAGIYAEEMTNSLIDGNTFIDNFRGILLFKAYSTNGVDMGGVTISDNDFTDSHSQAVEVIVQAGTGAGAGMIVDGNTIHQDVGILDTNFGLIDVRLARALTHQTVTVSDNRVFLSGTFTTATAAHGIILRGNGPISVTGNVLLGGDVAGVGTQPPSSGIVIRSMDPTPAFGTLPATAVITASCNRIEGFANGVSIYDAVALAYGGLVAGTTVTIDSNSIFNNNSAGVVNGATPVIDAEDNYWGCEEGPGNPGCDGAVGGVDFDPFVSEPPVCVACLADVECDDGLICTGTETCDDDTLMCVSGTAVVCDDGNACTLDTCNEPGGCASTPVPDNTPCNDGVMCSLPDTCQLGVCDGGGTDLNGNHVCDEDEELSVSSAAIKAQKPGKSNGKAGARGFFVTDPPADTFSAAAPITVSVRDANLAGAQRTFAPAECKTKGAKITCRSVDKTAKAVFIGSATVPGGFSINVRLKKLGVDGPFLGPLRATLSYGAGPVRQDDIGTCTAKSTSIKCK